MDITNSNLQANATEFRPEAASQTRLNSSTKGGSHVQSSERFSPRGAIKRNNYHNRNKPNAENKLQHNRNQASQNDECDKAATPTAGRSDHPETSRTKYRQKRYNNAVNGNNSQIDPQGNSNRFKIYSNSQYRGNNFRENYNRNRDRNNWASKDNASRRNTQQNWRQRDNKTDLAKEMSSEVDIDGPQESGKTEIPTIGSNEELYKKPNSKFKKKLDAGSQRERLEEMISRRTLECLICCEKLRVTDKIWSCKQCYHILHLDCTNKWAKSSRLEQGWRCPACQNVLTDIPNEYLCYCDKFVEPKFQPALLPHSCGEVCLRKGRNCEHTCTLLCHPGPCPDCIVMVRKSCGCGRTAPTLKCNSTQEIVCGSICSKTLNCGIHNCDRKCHWNACEDCQVKIQQNCFCGKDERQVACTADAQGVSNYSCGNICGKTLTCGNHICNQICHEGDCQTCANDPQLVKTCPCGTMELVVDRLLCTDPIPCCDKICNKRLKCGQPSNPHVCSLKCHTGDCGPCPLTTMVRCRCGHMDQELTCAELTTKADDARCKKKCTKKRLCMKHRCNQHCCIEVDHICPLLCNHMLSCGLHRCESTCHVGRCQPCWRTSFEELYCECGANVIYPPVPCGTRPPDCTNPCSRPRPCGHEPLHYCHTGRCPPCTHFTTKLCHGGHESRGTIPCHQEDFSCGLRCNMEMHCGQHLCNQICHKGACPSPCTQPCIIPRANCEHACNKACHAPPCPVTACRQIVTVTCECGLRTGTRICMDLDLEYQKIAMAQVAIKMSELEQGQSVDVSEFASRQRKSGVHKILECNEECKIVERNRRMAIVLQIRNPDLSAKLTPRYSDYMKQWAKKDPRFCENIHAKLTELVQLAKQSKQKSRSHSFDCMNREKRHFVHEYCEHFGCSSAAYDREPNRNIVATATKDKSWLPSCSLIELLQRENGQRKVPGPVMSKPAISVISPNESFSLRRQQAPVRNIRPSTPEAEFIDYFDNPP